MSILFILICIGFTAKYNIMLLCFVIQTEAGCVEPTTITIYSDLVGSSLDVRHMLNMKSNFINRLV